MKTSLQRLTALIGLLDSKQWSRVRTTERFFLYTPADFEGVSNFELVVPRNPDASDFDKSIDNSIAAVASFYRTPFASLEALLLPNTEILAVRLQGEDFTGGAAPLPQFERTLEHLKRTISRTASFILTDDPLGRGTAGGAQKFLDECWFLQTARGSFVTRVALPTGGTFGPHRSLFLERSPAKVEVVSAIREVSQLVGERVLQGDDTVFSDEGFEALRPSLSVGVLEEFGRLIRGSQAERLEISFRRRDEVTQVELPDLSPSRLQRLDTFVGFVKERLHASFELDVVGRVFDVRRSRRGTFSFVGLEGEVDGRPEYITCRVEAQSLPVMLQHLQLRRPIRIRGRARRLRTQIRIEREFAYQEIK